MIGAIFEDDEDTYMSESSYTGMYINVENTSKEILDVLQLGKLKFFSNRCTELSLGVQQNYVGEINPFPINKKGNKTERGIIIVLPSSRIKDNIWNESLLDNFRSGAIYDDSLGHCYFTWDTEQKICGIWDVCLHKTKGKGLGSKLMEPILDSLLTHLPDDIMLWLGIDMRNNYFYKVASLYAKFGFKSPLIADTDPFGNNWSETLPYSFISMKRNNDYIDPVDIKRESVLTHIKYIRTNFININNYGDKIRDIENDNGDDIIMNDINPSCTLNMRFNKSFAKWLKRLPLSASSLNENGTITQKEISSSFFLDNPKENSEGKIIWEIIRDKKVDKNFGEEEGVIVQHSRYNFHTHPREAYLSHNVKIGYPSGEDYLAFLKYSLYNEIKTIFHCVITVEGIYTISIAEYWIQNFENLQKLVLDKEKFQKSKQAREELQGLIDEMEKSQANIDPKIREYKEKLQTHIDAKKIELKNPLDLQINEITRAAIMEKLNIRKEFPPNIQKSEEAGKFYSEYINERHIIYDDNGNVYPPVFHVSFNSWDNIIKGQVISIYYPTEYSQCFVRHKTIKNYEELKGIIQ